MNNAVFHEQGVSVAEASLSNETHNTTSVAWFDVFTQLMGGITLFLYGLNKLSSAMKRLAGKKVKQVMVRLTTNPGVGLVVGMLVTGISNSLTLVSVLLVGLVASGVLQLESTIPVLLGAGIGSTLISLLVALKITKYGLLLVSAAYFYSAWIKKKSERNVLQSTNINDFDHNGEENRGSEVKLDIADCVFGLGLIFFGSQVMGNTFGFLGKNETFVTFLEHLHSPFLGLLTGFLLTVLVNSSGAAIGILLSLSEHGLLNGRAGIAMVLGANVGTCVTACIAGFSQGRAPFEVAIALVLVRAVGALFFTVTIQPLQTLSRTICGVSIDADLALLAAEPGHVHPSQALSLDVSCQIAASHSLFNIILAVVLLPFIRLYARAVRNVAAFLLRDGKTSSPQRISPPSFEITVV